MEHARGHLNQLAESLSTLASTYLARNKGMGPPPKGWLAFGCAESRAAAQRKCSKDGPLVSPGLRAALWSPAMGRSVG